MQLTGTGRRLTVSRNMLSLIVYRLRHMMALLRALGNHHWCRGARAGVAASTRLRLHTHVMRSIALAWNRIHGNLRVHLHVHVMRTGRVAQAWSTHSRTLRCHELVATGDLPHVHWMATLWSHTVAGHGLLVHLHWLATLVIVRHVLGYGSRRRHDGRGRC
jgi:hypothetical protein